MMSITFADFDINATVEQLRDRSDMTNGKRSMYTANRKDKTCLRALDDICFHLYLCDHMTIGSIPPCVLCIKPMVEPGIQ